MVIPGGARRTDPAHYHARLIRLYWPMCEVLANELTREAESERALAAGRPTPATPVISTTYGRFGHWDQPDWHPTFAERKVTHFCVAKGGYEMLDRIPQTAYPGLSEQLAATVGVLARSSDDRGYSLRTRQVYLEHLRAHPETAAVLREGTILGDAYWNHQGISGLADSITRTLHSSITSFGQGIALLAQERVAGFDDGMQLAHAIVASDVLNELSLLAPPNLIGPMARDGRVFPIDRLLVATGDGGIAMAPDLRDLLRTEKAAYVASLPEGPRVNGTGNAGQGCPMGHHSRVRESGIDLVGEAFTARMDLVVPEIAGPHSPGRSL